MAKGRAVLSVGDYVLNNRYKILKLIASKGMSAVYLIEDTFLHKKWCLKEIKKSNAGKGNVEYEALVQEANIMKHLDHSGIPRITTIEEDGDSLFIVMDYVDGMSVKQWLVERGKISQDIVLLWMKQITQTMMYLHNRKHPIFYRDMKPDNIMISKDGNLKILDFGISMVLKGDGSDVIVKALGTKGYAAPEQSKRGLKCDLRSDIYAMGWTMYFMLTGINPSSVSNRNELKGVREIDPSIDKEVEDIVIKCCEVDPNKRYQSCEELLYDLQNCKAVNKRRRASLLKKIVLTFSLCLASLPMLYGFYVFRNIGYSFPSLVFLAGGALSLLSGVISMIACNIPVCISELSGKNRKRQITKLKQIGTGGLDKLEVAADAEILAEGFMRTDAPVNVKEDDWYPTGVVEETKETEAVEKATGELVTKESTRNIGVFMSKKRTVKIISEQSSL